MVAEMLAYAEVGEYLDCDPEPGSNLTLLGLTQDKLDRINSHKPVCDLCDALISRSFKF
jgi:hypothetical protein